jgi:hypothetical protein
MKSTRISVWLSSLPKIVCYGSLVTFALLSVGLLAATASAESPSSPSLQGLPTRPPPPRPTQPPSPPQPTSKPPSPSQPTPEPPAPVLPTPVPPTPTPIPSVDLTLEELGYDSFQLFGSGSKQIDLYLPRHFVPRDDESYLELIISHAPPEPDKLSVINVTLNGTPLTVIALSPENSAQTNLRLSLQNTPLTSGHNALEISLDAEAACNAGEDQVTAVVYGSSSFHLEYALAQHTPDLALYPIPFFEPSFEYEPVYFVLPQNPAATDLSAAATVAAGLGKSADGEFSEYLQLASVLDTQISLDVRTNHHLIVIGKKGANRLLEQLDLPLPLDDPSLSDEQGVIQELVSPWNPQRLILVITGGNDEGLVNASQALNRKAHLLDMQGPVAIVDAVFSPEPVEDSQPDVDFTVADLGYEEGIFYGTRPHTLDYRFDMPLGFDVIGDARFTLRFAHASIASPTSSSLDVHFNDIPLRSILLDESNASVGNLEVLLPHWLIRPGRNEIHVSVEMNLDNEDKCLFLDAEHVWTAIYSDSSFHLPYSSQELEPTLNLFPYPFGEQPGLSGLTLVLPDRPRQLDYDLMLNLAAGLGAVDQGDSIAADATTADLVTQENRQNKDLILIGRPSIHSLIADLNGSLPQPFEPGSDQIRSQIESVLLVQDPSRSIGLIEELAAPWEPERTILVLSGTTDEGVGLAGTILLSQSEALAGNVALVEEIEGSVQIHTFDTRSLLSMPGGGDATPDVNQTLAQLSERWW